MIDGVNRRLKERSGTFGRYMELLEYMYVVIYKRKELMGVECRELDVVIWKDLLRNEWMDVAIQMFINGFFKDLVLTNMVRSVYLLTK